MAKAVRADAENRTFFLSGELDMSNAAELASIISEANWLDDGPVRFDLSGVEFIDSTGLQALMSGYAIGRTLILVAPTAPVENVLRIVGFDVAVGVEIEHPSEV